MLLLAYFRSNRPGRAQRDGSLKRLCIFAFHRVCVWGVAAEIGEGVQGCCGSSRAATADGERAGWLGDGRVLRGGEEDQRGPCRELQGTFNTRPRFPIFSAVRRIAIHSWEPPIWDILVVPGFGPKHSENVRTG